MRGPRRSPIIGLVLLACAVHDLGCGDENGTSSLPPACVGGTITGSIHGPSGPISALITVETPDSYWFSEGVESVVTVHDSTDSVGRFRIDVPEGRYVLWATHSFANWQRIYWSSNGAVAYPSRPDTIEIARGDVVDLGDIALGGMEVQLSVHSSLDGRGGRVTWWTRSAGGERFYDVASEWVFARKGHVEISSTLPPGTYVMTLSFGSGRMLWLPGATDPSDADTVIVRADEVAHYEASPTQGVTRLSGRMEGSWRELGLDPPRVEFFDPDSLRIGSAYPDESGFFSGEFLAIGAVRLLLESEHNQRWLGGDTFESATVFDLQPGQEISNIHVSCASISIRFVAPGYYSEVRGNIEVTNSQGRVVVRSYTWGPDFSGITNLNPGTYYLHVEPGETFGEGWLAQWYDHAASLETATPIVLSGPEDLVTATVALDPGGTVEGRLFDSRGDAVSSAAVFVTSDLSSEFLGRPPSPRRGVFAVRGLPDGDYKISAGRYSSRPGPIPPDSLVWFPGTVSWDSATVISIRNHAQVSGIDIILP